MRDALIAYDRDRVTTSASRTSSLPVVAETYDGWLNDINGFHVTNRSTSSPRSTPPVDGPVAEGCVGGGTGMICHEFKGGIGTSVARARRGARRLDRRRAGAGELRRAAPAARSTACRSAREIGYDEVPSRSRRTKPSDGSIIIVVATDAPLLPHQCRRLAQRATIGLARVGGNGDNGSGDIFLAFATGNRGMFAGDDVRSRSASGACSRDAMTPLFEAAADATEEAILNALCMATTMTGVNGRTSHALPLDRVRELMAKYNRLAS